MGSEELKRVPVEQHGRKQERLHQWFLFRASIKRLCIRIFILYFFTVAGAFLFRWAESMRELEFKCGVKKVRRDFLDSLWQGSQNSYMKEDDWKSLARRRLLKFEEELHTAYEAGINTYSGQRSWSFLNAVFYSLTIMTTIGYGHITPITSIGKLVTVLYAMVGIPTFTIVLNDTIKVVSRGIKLVLTRNGNKKFLVVVDDEFRLPIWIGLCALCIYAIPGTIFFWLWENDWGIIGSFYFILVSTSTIGFGDFVPQSPLIAVLFSIYFLFGLALTAGVLGLVQEKLEGVMNMLTAQVGDIIGVATNLVPPSQPRSESEAVYYKED